MLRHITVGFGAFALALAAYAADEAKVTPIQITETRAKALAQVPNMGASEPGLAVRFRVEGPAMKGATSWGKLQLTEAKDDTGASLQLLNGGIKTVLGGAGAEWVPLQGSMVALDEKSGGSADVEINFTLPSRKATAITSMKGQFQIQAGGEERMVSLTKPKSMIGKPLTDPALKQAGIDITVAKDEDDPNALAMEMRGNLPSVKDLLVVDSTGSQVNTASKSRMRFGGTRVTTYTLSKPLDDTMNVRMIVMVGLKPVTVPFEAKNIALP